MSVWIRTWKKFELEDIGRSLLVIGVLSAECFACHNIGIAKDSSRCPDCGAEFKYAGFRKNAGYREIEQLSSRRNITIIDFDDFLKAYKRKQAEGFLENKKDIL